MGDDVATFEERKEDAKRRVVLSHMDHDRQIAGRGLGAPERFEIVRPSDIGREARLDTDNDVAVA